MAAHREAPFNGGGRGEEPAGIRSGSRIGGFLMLVDTEGCRHALRFNAILGLQDLDACADQTLVTLTGGRTFILPEALDVVLSWMVL